MSEAEIVRERALAILAAEGPMTTAELLGSLLRGGLEADSGQVHALLTAEALAGVVKVGSREEDGARVPMWRLARHSLLAWERPPRAEDAAVRAEYWGGGIPGAYAPNMSREWMSRWKAVMEGTRKPPLRVTIRKSTGITRGSSCQVKVIAAEDGLVTMSMNGTATFGAGEWAELFQAVAEARAAMARNQAEKSYQDLPGHVRAAVEGADAR